MGLATLKEVLDAAERDGCAVPAFNIDNMEIPQVLVEAAVGENSPVILMVGQGAIQAGKLEYLADMTKRLATQASVPVVLHLDHGASYEQCIQCLRAGFSSVMIDGSTLPLSENIRLTQSVVRAARAVGVSVEAELGTIAGVEDGVSHKKRQLVDPGEVKAFQEAVRVDALAVGIGNAHGLYVGKPELDFELLRTVETLSAAPLVLHGGSGIPDDMIRRAISLGIRKINVATEIRIAYMEGLERSVSRRDIYPMYETAKAAVARLAGEKIRLFRGESGLAEAGRDESSRQDGEGVSA